MREINILLEKNNGDYLPVLTTIQSFAGRENLTSEILSLNIILLLMIFDTHRKEFHQLLKSLIFLLIGRFWLISLLKGA